MTEHPKFPHTPHLAWLGTTPPRADKVLSRAELKELLSGFVTVEEKLDGANIGISVGENRALQVQNRGTLLERGRTAPQFKHLFAWVDAHAEVAHALGQTLMLFGEWCYAVHSVRYARLPGWFVGFDVFDRDEERFYSVERRDALLLSLRVPIVPKLGRGTFALDDLKSMLGASKLGDEPAEGLYVRRDDPPWLSQRAKLVRPEFVQAIDAHWSRRPLEPNRLDAAASPACVEEHR